MNPTQNRFAEPEGVIVGVVGLHEQAKGRDTFLLRVARAKHKLQMIRELRLPDWVVPHTTIPQLEALTQKVEGLRAANRPFRVSFDYQEGGEDGHRRISGVHLWLEEPEYELVQRN